MRQLQQDNLSRKGKRMELNLLSEFIGGLQDEKRDMMQLTALYTRLFIPLKNLHSFAETKNYSAKDSMASFNKNLADEWVSFTGAVADMGESCQISVQSTVSLSGSNRDRAEFALIVGPVANTGQQLTVDGCKQEINIPYGGVRMFQILDKRPIGSLLRCPNCGKIFINTTKRHMKFCSTNCRSHYSMKKARGQL
jgi:uncharacterized C2H2 Zn-finger protein